jgi:hypothetical protein
MRGNQARQENRFPGFRISRFQRMNVAKPGFNLETSKL